MPDAIVDDLPTLRRDILAAKDALLRLTEKVRTIDTDAAVSLERARVLAFEAWTILCGPPENDDDH